MDQHDPRQQKNNPMFDDIKPSIIPSQFTSKKDVSFSCYLKHHNNLNNITEESDQISIFDAAKYFSGLHNTQQQLRRRQQQRNQCTKEFHIVSPIPPRLSSVSSFHATPTASSEARMNSQAGLPANPPGSIGISLIKSFSNNSSGNRGTNNKSNVGPKWPRISTKWLIRGKKCPCLSKKSVQVVEERITSKTNPRIGDIRHSTSSYGSNSLYSPRQSSPNNLGTNVASSIEPILPRDPKAPNFNLVVRNSIKKIGHPYNSNNNNNNKNHSNGGFLSLGLNSKVVGPLTLYDDLDKVNKGGGVTSNNVVTTTTVAAAATTIADIASPTSNGFTFPILENQPIGLKKMFNVIPPSHHNKDDPHRDSLEVFQPRSPTSPKSRRMNYEDENVSDGSSDLFEIESFSTTSYPYRDSIDEVIVPSSNVGSSMKKYAPNEVSIDWSVTTAEGFDHNRFSNFSASASEVAYKATRCEAEQYGGGGDGGGGEECMGNGKNISSGNLLLGCKNENVVNVGLSPIKCLGQEGPQAVARHVSGRPQGQC